MTDLERMDAWAEALKKQDALLFATGVLGFLMPTPGVLCPEGSWQLEPWQVQALEEFTDMFRKRLTEPARLSIKAGHSVGKTTFLAIVTLFLLSCAPKDVKIPVVSASQDQLRSGLWPEIQKWQSKLPSPLRENLTWTGERVVWTAEPTQAFAVQRTASKNRPEVLQGMHSTTMCAMFEEASGIIEEAYEASIGALASPGAMGIWISNPTRRTGYFHATHHSMRARFRTMTVNCEDVPRARSHINDIIDRYGKDSNAYRVRVLGEFPEKDDDTVIPLSWVTGAQGRDVAKTAYHPNWGIDVALHGDDRSCLVIREGNYLIGAPYVWSNMDEKQLCGRILDIYERTPNAEKPHNICVDCNGIGRALYAMLTLDNSAVRHLVREVVVQEKPNKSDRYRIWRDELWFQGREWFQTKGVCFPTERAKDGPPDEDGQRKIEQLIAELTTPTYDMASSGKIVVQSKDDMKKNGMRSPDIADAFLLTFAAPDVPREEAYDVHRRRDRHRSWEQHRDPWSI